MPQNKKKNLSNNLSKKKDTTSRIQKVAQRKARKDGMMMKKKLPAAKQIKENLHKAMTKSIEDEMCARVGASAANTLKIVAGKIDKKKASKK